MLKTSRIALTFALGTLTFLAACTDKEEDTGPAYCPPAADAGAVSYTHLTLPTNREV